MSQTFFVNSQEKLDVLKLTENLIVKINEISELNTYKHGLFKDLFTTEFIENVDSIVLHELAVIYGLEVNLPNNMIKGYYVKMYFKWGSCYVVSNTNYN